MSRMRVITLLFLAVAITGAQAQQRPLDQAAEGLHQLFNGKDLSGWRGRSRTTIRSSEAKLTPAERTAKQAAWNAERDLHWRVDTAKGEIVSDGKSPHLATDKDYGDFEMHVDWLMVSAERRLRHLPARHPAGADLGPGQPARAAETAPTEGSGALWNNNPDNPGKWPLVKADNPVGQWNTFKIRMVGDEVWIWLNDKLTVDGQVLDNFFDRRRNRCPRAGRSSCRRTARRSGSATSTSARSARPRPRRPRRNRLISINSQAPNFQLPTSTYMVSQWSAGSAFFRA